jgi:hypothetical protein
MRRGYIIGSLATVIGLVLGTGTAQAVPPQPPAGFHYVNASEHVMMGIGCQQGAGGTCDTTEYWLGDNAGTDNVGTTASATPVEYIFAAGGAPEAYAVFGSDDTLAPDYVLRAGEPITGQVSVGGYFGGAEAAADATATIELTATKVSGNQIVALGSATVNKPVVTPGDTVYEYSIQVPATQEGVKVRDLSLTLYFKNVTVLQNGFVDGEGGSSFDLPYYRLVPGA